MTELVDAKIIGELARIFRFQPERIIWGQLFTARLYWGEFYSSVPGTAMLPYMAVYRLPKFHDSFKKTEKTEIVDTDGNAKMVDFLPVMLNYTVEIVSSTVVEQNAYFKYFMLWAGKESAIGFMDDLGVPWKFRIIPEDPEDTSDLESEEDQGRIIRTTFNFQVESIMLDKEDIAGPILEILSRIHCYYTTPEESVPVLSVTLS